MFGRQTLFNSSLELEDIDLRKTQVEKTLFSENHQKGNLNSKPNLNKIKLSLNIRKILPQIVKKKKKKGKKSKNQKPQDKPEFNPNDQLLNRHSQKIVTSQNFFKQYTFTEENPYPQFFHILTHQILIPLIKNTNELKNPALMKLFISTSTRKIPKIIQSQIVQDIDVELKLGFSFEELFQILLEFLALGV